MKIVFTTQDWGATPASQPVVSILFEDGTEAVALVEGIRGEGPSAIFIERVERELSEFGVVALTAPPKPPSEAEATAERPA